MTVTITPEVTQHASIVRSVLKRISELEDEHNSQSNRLGNEAARVAGAMEYTNEWYEAYSKGAAAAGDRDTYVDQGLVLSGFAGWKMLGSGCYRQALMGPDSYVYKIESWGESNKTEASVSERLRDKEGCPKAFRVLDMKLVGEILVTEYAPRDHNTSPGNHHRHPEWTTFLTWVQSHGCSVMDTHEQNIWWDGEAFVIIDAGNWAVR